MESQGRFSGALLVGWKNRVLIEKADGDRGLPQPAGSRAPAVPPPTGTLPVGTKTMALIDRSRRDPFASDGRRRRILAQVYYPALSNGRRARYMPLAVATAVSSASVPVRALASVRTDLAAGTPARRGHYPLLLFSPGYTVPHYLYTALLEDLASRGYVVIALDHTYETEAVEFPNGDVVRRTLPDDPKNIISKPISARLNDVAFLIKTLASLEGHGALAGADVTRIGIFGHSLGGLTAVTAAAANRSIACSADLAGSVFGKARRKPFRRPSLIMDGSQREATLRAWWANLAGTRYWVTLKTAKHLNFADWSWLVPALKAAGLNPQVKDLGPIDGVRAVRLERLYLGAFFDHCLKHKPATALTTPPPPDVVIKR
jgi:dienelactone hydrolase